MSSALSATLSRLKMGIARPAPADAPCWTGCSIRTQLFAGRLLRDLVRASAEIIAEERARTFTDGWGARLLSLQAKTASGRAGRASRRRASTNGTGNRASPGSPHCRHFNCCMISGSIRARSGSPKRWRWCENTAAGSMLGSRFSTVRSSHASTAGPSRWAFTFVRMWMVGAGARNRPLCGIHCGSAPERGVSSRAKSVST